MENAKRGRQLFFLRLFSILTTIIYLLGIHSVQIEAVVNPDEGYYVTDKVGVLNLETKSHILEVNRIFEKTKEKPQIAIVVIPSLEEIDIETYAVEQFEKMEIGNREYDNGVLILLSSTDRKIRIEVGYGLEGALPDSKVGRIIDASIEDLAAENYSNAIRDIFNQIVLEVQTEYSYDDLFDVEGTSLTQHDNSGYIVIFVFVGFIVYMIVCRFLGLDIVDSLLLLQNLIITIARSSSVSRSTGNRSSGGGGRSGGGGASRGF